MSIEAEDLQTDNINVVGNPDAPVVVVCDAPSEAVWKAGSVMAKRAMQKFAEVAERNGFSSKDFCFVTGSPPIPELSAVSEGKINAFVGQYREEAVDVLQQLQGKNVIVYLGKTAGRQVMGRPVQVTKVRGRLHDVEGYDVPVFPMLSPANVLSRPDTKETFEADFQQLARFRDVGWIKDNMVRADDVANFRWCDDIQFLLDNPPKALSVDTETDGLKYAEGAKILVVSLCWNEKESILLPVDRDYYPALTEAKQKKLMGQLKDLLENPAVAVTGHNFKYDFHMFQRAGIRVANWYCDTLQLAFCADDNMIVKSLSDCCKRWIPSIAGYSDKFEDEVDYAKMREVPHEEMLNYACGDTLATLLLTKHLLKLVQEDKRQWNTFVKVQMPALRVFADMEDYGVSVDTEKLAELEVSLAEMESELYNKLIERVPPAVKRKHLADGLSFGREAFTADVLFSREGMRLTPRVFTKSTRKLSGDERKPSTSAKDHLPYFADNPFVLDLIEYKKLTKMRSTYVGKARRVDMLPVHRTKTGKLPKRAVMAFAKKGLTITDDLQVVREGMPIRSRMRALEIDDGAELRILHQVLSEDGCGFLLGSDRVLYERQVMEASGFWKYLQNGNEIHPSFYLHGTVTGRSASSNPNLQNVPKRGKLAKEFRKIFLPPSGFKFIQVDLSQAELRVAAWMANETTMLKIYQEGGDIHSYTAAAILKITMKTFMSMKGSDKKVSAGLKTAGFDGETFGEFYDYRRYCAKAVAFGFLYGMGWKGFMVYARTTYGLDVTETEAREFRDTFFRLYPKLERWHENMREAVAKYGYVRALHGALRRLPNIESDDEVIQGMSERQGINSPVQRFASDLGLIGMSRFGQTCPWEVARPSLFIHDAVVAVAREDLVETAASNLRYYMENQPLGEWFGLESPIPIIADVEQGWNLSELEPMEVKSELVAW